MNADARAPWPPGDGGMARRVRAHDWSATPLGPLEGWPQSLRTTVDIVLSSGAPTAVLWGPERVVIPSDGFCDWFPGEPFGPARERWPALWEHLAPLHERALAGETARRRDARGSFVCSPVRDERGAVAGVLVTAQEPADERYRTLFHSIDDGFCLMQMIVDERGETVDYRFLDTNETFEAHTGLVNAAGRTARELVPDLDPSWFRLYGEVARTGVSTRFENHAPAMHRWFEVYASRVGRPELRQVALVFKDITGRKDAEAQRDELLASERLARAEAQAERDKQHALFMQAPVAIAILDGPDHVFSFANPAYRRLVNGRDVVGKPLRLALPELEQDFHRLLDRVMETGEAYVGREVPVRLAHHGPGEQLVLDFVYTPKRDATGRIDGVLLSAVDVTESVGARRRVEAHRRAAEDANRSKDEFLATMSHELRTPLNAVLGWARMLQSGVLADDQRDRALASIERNARAQVALIEDVLDVSRIVSGKLRLDLSTVELDAVVVAAIDTVRAAADAKGVRLHVHIEPDIGTSRGDPVRLQQVATNLLTNAVKFTPAGGRVYVRMRRVEHSAELVVSDTGQGISREFLPHVFERFRQADATVTRSHGGLGLGLSIVQHLVEAHGGTIVAQSDGPGRGATFTLRIPLAPRDAPRALGSARPARTDAPLVCPPVIAGLRVLVVDDEPDALELLATLLHQCRAEVATAASGREALERFGEARPDLIVSDVGMPEQDGHSLIRAIRALPPDAGGDTPALALTAFARSEDRIRALESGFTGHIAKPVEPQALLDAIAQIAQARR